MLFSDRNDIIYDKLLSIPSTSIWYLSMQPPIWVVSAPPKMKGNFYEPKQYSGKLVCFYLIRILVYQPMKPDCIKLRFLDIHLLKACLKRPHRATGEKRLQMRAFHNKFWSGRPISSHSFNDELEIIDFADAW